MSKKIIPEEALNQHVAILGKTGSGKTYAAKGIVEHLLNQERQVCVLDPTGAWWGLRLGADGKSKGYDVVLLGGKNADIPLSPRSGEAVARLVTQQFARCVIDTSGFTVGEYTRWFIDFAGALYTTITEPLHLVIDEAHYFMPQGKAPDVDAGKMIHAGNRLMSGGRSRGVRGMMITQRPAKLHKDSLTCADTLIAMRVIAPQDRAAIKEWIDGAGDPAQGKKVLDSLAQLEKGAGWVWYPEGAYLERVNFPAIKSYDSSATPKHGAGNAPKVGEIKLDEVKAALADAVKEAEANDPKLLRARIAELERVRPVAAPAANPSESERAKQIAYADGMNKGYATCLAAVGDAKRDLSGIVQTMGELAERIVRASESLASFETGLSMATPARISAPRFERAIPPVVRKRVAASATRTPHDKILDAIAWWNAIGVPEPTRQQVAAKLGYHERTKGFLNLMRAAHAAGEIEYGSGTLTLTHERESPLDIGTRADLHRTILESLPSQQHRQILEIVLVVGEGGIDRADLAARVGKHERTKGFLNVLGALSGRGLVEYIRGGVKAADFLFPEGLQ